MNQSTLQRGHHGLGAIAHIEPHENGADVTLNCCLGNSEQARDFFVAHTLHQMAKHFLFA